MKRICILIASLFLASSVLAAPAVFFSDLTSGPNIGGQNNRGLFVTVIGKGFGASRDASTVTIGSGTADNYPLWSDTKIVFQLGFNAQTGDIVVHTVNGDSNSTPFTVRDGRIFFVNANSPNNPGSGTYLDPWRSPRSFMDCGQQPGDTCYIRNGSYLGPYGYGAKSCVSYYKYTDQGAANNEIAWVGYPGEVAYFYSNGGSVEGGCFDLRTPYVTIAGLRLHGYGNGIDIVRMLANYTRLVNCDIVGSETLCYGYATTAGAHIKVLGNTFRDGTSREKQDHVVYFQSGTTDVEVAYNRIVNNDIAEGPIFSCNDNNAGETFDWTIHHNYIDCWFNNTAAGRQGASRLLCHYQCGSQTVSYLHNNIILNGDAPNWNDDRSHVIYLLAGSIVAENNTFYGCTGNNNASALFAANSGQNLTIKNNTIYNNSNLAYVGGSANVTFQNNCYYNGYGTAPSGTGNVAANPKFTDTATGDFHLDEQSPCIGRGSNTVLPRCSTDFDGVVRSVDAVDIGAFQFSTSTTSSPPVRYTLSGYVRDNASNPVIGTVVQLTGEAVQDVTVSATGLYAFTDLSSGTYTVTPSSTNWTFSPENRVYADLAASADTQNFIGATGEPAAISLTVTVDNNAVDAFAHDTTATVTYTDSTAGVHYLRILGPDGRVTLAQQASGTSGSFSWTPAVVGMHFPLIKGSTMFYYKAIRIE